MSHSNSYLVKVQQKVSHCQLLLSMLETQPTPGRQAEEALLQSAVLHLAIAMRLYFRELAVYSHIPHPEAIYSLSDLMAKLAPNMPLHEIGSHSWIHELMEAERQILSPTELSDNSNLIAHSAGKLGGQPITFSRRTAEHWLTQFQQMSERQRASLVEY